MAFYSYFANGVMLILLSCGLYYMLETLTIRAHLLKQHRNAIKKLNDKSLDIEQRLDLEEEYIPYRLVKHAIKQKCKVKFIESSIQKSFEQHVHKIHTLRGIAPAFGLFFTVTSIILSFGIFADNGDIREMFAIAAIGFSTTAMGAATIVICRIATDKITFPLVCLLNEEYRSQINTLYKVLYGQSQQLSLKGAANENG